MKCKEVQERLSEYLEETISPQGYEAVKDHLSVCPECSAQLEILTQSIRAVADLPDLEPPPGFSQKAMARIQEEAEKQAS